MQFKISICKRINELREIKGMSWQQLVYAAGYSKGMITDLKNAKVEPRLSTVCRIAAALDMKPSELLDFNIDFSEFDKEK